LLVLPVRAYAHNKNNRDLEKLPSLHKSPYRLPWREFSADLAAWLIAGLIMATLYLLYFNAPFLTGIKVLFGGMLSFLATEKRIIALLKTGKFTVAFFPKRIFSVGSKILFLMGTVLLLMGVVILLMVFVDINYLLNSKAFRGPDIYFGVFKDILFAFVVLLGLSIIIVRRYSQNLRSILTMQVGAMETISGGDYNTQVPVVSNDEFGLIAAKTNEMVNGLKERDMCQVSFGKFVTPEVSEKILKGEISPEGESNEVTILFCDLRGYTPFVERSDPKDVVRFLNAYFSEMETAIRQYNGIVLQYIGDEIEAVFGAPIHEPDHPQMAVLAAFEMRKRLENLNNARKKTGEAPITHGIGIHTGMVLAGTVGSPERLVYAMVGDTVNLASRIHGLNKQFQTDILISRTTKERLRAGKFELVSLGQTVIRGKSGEVEIFKVL
jgi:adenylate cyclase